ncbi:hypothetical protein FOA52_010081 [Chlamydomonas sp. UWO 241]|nr:hypothetical protein FOA52_010081 [Chlamydomonas sp. UWO 241]
MGGGASHAYRGGDASSGTEASSRVRPRVTISYEEEEQAYTAVPASNRKTLKINIDLMIWRSRQARIRAQASMDREERRTLLKQAEASLRRALELDAADPRTYVVLGKTLLQGKRYEEARRLYNQGTVATANNSPYIWSAWGWLEFKTGNIAAARKLFDAAVVVDETHACAWHKWGMLERSEGNYMRARDLWMQGIQKCRRRSQSQNAYLYNALAVMAAQVGRVEEARAWFEEGTRTLEGGASVALWQAWAVLEAKQGDPTAVRYLFKRALGVNPRSRYVHLAWAMWERKQGNVELCVQLLTRGNQLNPTDPAIYQAWAIVQKERGRTDEARKLFEAGVRADPSHLHLWQAWGCMEASLGNGERARELFQEGVWADPRSRDTVFIFHAWAVLERSEGNVGLARELFKAAIKVDPQSSKVWLTWITMEEELGMVDRAEDLRQRQAEQQYVFEVPYNFTTRPGATVGSALSGLLSTLQNFFTAREKATGSSTGSGPATARSAAATSSATADGGARSLRSLLPEDFDSTLSPEDILPDISSLLPDRRRAAAFASVDDVTFKEDVPKLRASPIFASSGPAEAPSAPLASSSSVAAVAAAAAAASASASASAHSGGDAGFMSEQQARELELLALLDLDDDSDDESSNGGGANGSGGGGGKASRRRASLFGTTPVAVPPPSAQAQAPPVRPAPVSTSQSA